jgi:hypothetical protein
MFKVNRELSGLHKSNFVARLEHVLDDRKREQWCQELGFSNEIMGSLFFSSMKFPDVELLKVIDQAERVNLNWLLLGGQHPFRLDPTTSEQELIRSIHLFAPRFPKTFVYYSRADSYALIQFAEDCEGMYQGQTYCYEGGHLYRMELNANTKRCLDNHQDGVVFVEIKNTLLFDVCSGRKGLYQLRRIRNGPQQKRTIHDCFQGAGFALNLTMYGNDNEMLFSSEDAPQDAPE